MSPEVSDSAGLDVYVQRSWILDFQVYTKGDVQVLASAYWAVPLLDSSALGFQSIIGPEVR